ncbi:DUF2283 domain-containing protein [Haliscomenobacter sp.]|jgi:uncharacterized protein YuzE|uniref:DUF2283 domain-containing protein n=1 Tax=Haliscomenobacter sp. TaxID=2717303 RepID=UPI003364E7FA
MKFTYDNEADALYIQLSNQSIVDSEEVEPHVVVDYDKSDQIVGIEILYFVQKHKNELFPAFKAMEQAVWQEEYKKVG